MSAGAVEELIAQNRVVAREQARLLQLVLQVADLADDPRFGVDEIAFALAWTRAAADAQINLARQLIHHLPNVFTALHTGDIDLPKARVFADTLQTLDPQLAQLVAAQVLPVAPTKTTAQLRGMLHRRALAADPEHARKHREAAMRERRVIVEPAPDGTATLTALCLPPDRAQAAYERVTAIAKARKLSGATATLDQLRTDALLDLLDGTPIDPTPSPRRGVIELTAGLETLAGLNDNPATLHGFGPVAADIARQCAATHHDAQWRYSIYDPDGQLLFHGITRARPTTQTSPTPAQRTQAQHRQTRPAQAQRTRPQATQTPHQQAQHAQARPTQTQRAQPTQAHNTRPQAEQTQHEHPQREHTRPAQPPPVQTQRAQPRHAEAQPAQPAQPQPAQAQSEQAQPAQAQPAQPQPAQAQPAQAQPAQAQPAQAQPAQPQSEQAPPAQTQREQSPRKQRQPTQPPPTQAQPTQAQPTQSRQPTPCPPPQNPHARFPNAAMTAWIRARDRTCRAPGCRMPARHCHLDHTIDHAKGGPTSHDDLGPLCAHHHTMKHEGGWKLIQTRPGHFIWISPTGRIYHVGPEPP